MNRVEFLSNFSELEKTGIETFYYCDQTDVYETENALNKHVYLISKHDDLIYLKKGGISQIDFLDDSKINLSSELDNSGISGLYKCSMKRHAMLFLQNTDKVVDLNDFIVIFARFRNSNAFETMCDLLYKISTKYAENWYSSVEICPEKDILEKRISMLEAELKASKNKNIEQRKLQKELEQERRERLAYQEKLDILRRGKRVSGIYTQRVNEQELFGD